MIDTDKILQHYFNPDTIGYKIITTHGTLVAEKAVSIALKLTHLSPNISFIKEASMLHDIGVVETYSPDIGCFGEQPYLSHGIIGRSILETTGLDEHALVAERHILTGISINDIIERKLNLPQRDMLPVSIEEIIICYADNFFSKKPDSYTQEKPIGNIIKSLSKFGPHQVNRFTTWAKRFGDLPND